jgi:hypothetical protein
MAFIEIFSKEKNSNWRVFKEAIFCGIMVLLAAYAIKHVVKPYFKVDLPEICERWNEKHVFEVSMFLTGFFLHLFLEFTGVNKSYAMYRSKI